ncbi:MAG: DUF2062 domain-containing protein [Syntrophaceae bacterium]|nr:DUF2062 domain-containing protein [Syntrophaceae bacterium]
MKKNGYRKPLAARWRRWFRLFYLRMVRLRGQPEEVAGGMAIGVAIGLTPTVPLHLVLAVLIAFLMGKSKLAAALGSQVGNPFFLPFIYILDYKIGLTLTGTQGPSLMIHDFSAPSILDLGWDIYYPLLFGGGVVGALSILPTYLATRKLVLLSRERRRRRLEKIGLPS